MFYICVLIIREMQQKKRNYSGSEDRKGAPGYLEHKKVAKDWKQMLLEKGAFQRHRLSF